MACYPGGWLRADPEPPPHPRKKGGSSHFTTRDGGCRPRVNMRVETTSELLPLKRATRTRADHCGLIRWQELPPIRESIADPPQVLPQPLVDRPSTLEHNALGAKSFGSRDRARSFACLVTGLI